MSANDHKKIQSIDCKETYSYGTSENIIHKNEETRYRIIIKQYKNDQVWWCYRKKQKKS